ncbi:MAG: NAD(P)-binding protein [Myxococcales bacterium]|nr:NAD(P)-binding protein [Myxococcales bacterium]
MGAVARGEVPAVSVGAGLTGMAAAHFLRASGVTRRIMERSPVVGGHAVTVEERGYRFDRTGHLLHLRDRELEALALRWMGPAHHRITRQSRVWSHGVYTGYPFQAHVHGLPPEVAYDCLMGFLERRADAPIASFEDYCFAHFGRGISEHFMLPYNERLWGVPPSELTPAWCDRFVPRPTLAQVIAGAVGHEVEPLGYNATFLYPSFGIGQLSDGLARAVGDVETGREVRRIESAPRRLHLDGEVVAYDRLVSTMPLPALVAAIDDAPPEVRAAAATLRATKLWYLDVALRGSVGRPFHWIYVPERRYPFYRVGAYSSFSPAMTPPGAASLYVELVSREEPDLARLLPEVADHLVAMGLIRRREAIVFARARCLDHAYVVYDQAREAALPVIEAFLRSRRILSTGRYGAWNYSSMGDALRMGREAAAWVTEESA